MTLPGYDAYLQAPYMAEPEARTCAGQEDRECPSRGIVFTDGDFIPNTELCWECGGPTREMDREELRGE